MTMTLIPLNRRELAMLRAVVEGRAEITASCERDLFVDGIACCDQTAAHHLARGGYLRPARNCPIGRHCPAVLSDLGHHALSVTS